MSDGDYIINDEQYFEDKSYNEPIYDDIGPTTDNPFPSNIHPTAIVYPNVQLGKNVHIGAYCVIGGPPEHRGFWHKEYNGQVHIGDNVYISNLVTIDGGCSFPTVIGDNVEILAHAHVGHDANIGNNVTISCGAKIGGNTMVKEEVNIGLNACIHQNVIVPAGCMIGMGAIVTKKSELQPNKKYVGNPVREIGENIRK